MGVLSPVLNGINHDVRINHDIYFENGMTALVRFLNDRVTQPTLTGSTYNVNNERVFVCIVVDEDDRFILVRGATCG